MRIDLLIQRRLEEIKQDQQTLQYCRESEAVVRSKLLGADVKTLTFDLKINKEFPDTYRVSLSGSAPVISPLILERLEGLTGKLVWVPVVQPAELLAIYQFLRSEPREVGTGLK